VLRSNGKQDFAETRPVKKHFTAKRKRTFKAKYHASKKVKKAFEKLLEEVGFSVVLDFQKGYGCCIDT